MRRRHSVAARNGPPQIVQERLIGLLIQSQASPILQQVQSQHAQGHGFAHVSQAQLVVQPGGLRGHLVAVQVVSNYHLRPAGLGRLRQPLPQLLPLGVARGGKLAEPQLWLLIMLRTL